MFQTQDEPLSAQPVLVAPARHAVFGSPVAHSRSPWIHARFGEQAGIPLTYDAIEADVDAFPTALEAFARAGGTGANVTLPLKGAAAMLCSELGTAAQRAGVVNTLTRRPDGRWRGDNTDGVGLVRDITERQRVDIRGRRALVLGAGGAVRGVVAELLDAGVAEIVLANRTPARADAIADRIGEPARVHTRYLDALGDAGAFELVVNGTAAGHSGAPLRLPFSLAMQRTLAYDLNYGNAALDFLAWARAAGCPYVFDGLGMLVEQAAEAFRIWHGVRPDTEPVHQQLRALVPRS
jgi:shikimate dehydrogenase